MSEFIAEATVLVRPDTTKFRTTLITQLAVATKGVTVPVTIVPVASGASAAALAAQAAALGVTTDALEQKNQVEEDGVKAAQDSAKANAASARTLGQVEKGAIAAAAGMTGLRGAVLAASGPFLAATVAATAFGKSVQLAADLESNLNVFRVTAQATGDEMQRVGEEARELGRDISLPGVTANDAAQTFLTLSKAGLSVRDSIDGARGTLQLATAAQIEFADAAQLTASALNAFGLSGSQAIDVADLLTNAANASQASISDMGIALRQSAAIADLVGFSISETVTFLTQLARAGLAGSDAGTSFRVSIQRLIAPTDRAKDALEKLNVNLRDAAGNLRPEAFFELGQALERMGRAQADATRQVIFGNDASRAAAFFARINAEEFRNQEQALLKQGAAAEVAGARNEGFSGKVENLKNQLADLGIEIGNVTLGPLGVLVDLTALQFAFLARNIRETTGVLKDLKDAGVDVGGFLSDVSEDTGVTDFFRDVAAGARDAADVVAGPLEDALENLPRAGQAANRAVGPITKLTDEEKRLAEAIHDAVRPTVEQVTTLDSLSEAAARAAAAVARLQGQERGLEEQVTRARIAGDEQTEITRLRELSATLEEELRRQEAIIARPGERGEGAAREAIRNRILPQLEQTNNEIQRIIDEQRATNERLADDAAQAANERDRNLLDALTGRREDAGRRISAAADTEDVRNDIRRQDELQALIKQQIEKVRSRIRDEKLRKEVIRELRQALIDSRREEEALRQEQKEAAQARRETAQLRKEEIQQLNISIAEETGNKAALDRAINARITTLNKQIKAAKGDQLRVKQLILERERLKNQLEDLNETEKDNRKTAQQFFFEQLQAQQGFASNLLGNLITGPTAGLVGVPSTTTTPGVAVDKAARQAEAGKGVGPTSGQAQTTNTLLERILDQLKSLNGTRDHPEATHQRAVGAPGMDGTGNISGI